MYVKKQDIINATYEKADTARCVGVEMPALDHSVFVDGFVGVRHDQSVLKLVRVGSLAVHLVAKHEIAVCWV